MHFFIKFPDFINTMAWWINLVFLILPIIYFFIYRKYHSEGTITEDLKKFFGLKKIKFESLYLGVKLFFILIFVSIAINLVVSFALPQYNDLENVRQNVMFYVESGKLVYFFVMLVIGVFLEEYFFRAFLVNRIGIFLSTLAFALLHYGYGSWVEMIGAFVLGLILAWYYKKHQDLFVNFYAHILYNIFAIILMLV